MNDHNEEQPEPGSIAPRRSFSDWMKLLVWASMGSFSLMALYQLMSGQSLSELGWDKIMMSLNAIGLAALALHLATHRG